MPESNENNETSSTGASAAGGDAVGLPLRDADAVPARARKLEAQLRSVRAQARAQLILTRIALLVAAIAGATLLVGLADFVLRFPAALRGIFWLLGVTTLAAAIWRLLLPAARFNPSLTEIALRMERIESKRDPSVIGTLASALELARSNSPRAQETAGAILDRLDVRARATQILDPKKLFTAMAALALVLAPLAAIALARPELSRVGVVRVLAPWSDAQWPKRTRVADATGVVAHPLTKALPLRAVVQMRSGLVANAEVRVGYRVLVNDEATGAIRRAVLTPQGRTAKGETAGRGTIEGELHERLLDPASLTPPGWDARRAERGLILEYRFETLDDQTPWERVALVQPPSLVSATADVSLPEYAQGVAPATFIVGSADLGDGRDGRANLGPILGGSRIDVTLTLNRPLPHDASAPGQSTAAYPIELTGTPASDLASRVFVGLEPSDVIGATVIDATHWRLALAPKGSRRLTVSLVDANGIASDEDAALRLELVADRAPTALVAAPAQDEFVLTTAVLPIEADTRDDVALANARLDAAIARPPAGSPGALAEPVGDPIELASTVFGAPASGDSPADTSAPTPPDRTIVRLSHTLSLASLDARPGDEVRVIASATDVLGATAVSPVRTLRIISEAELFEQMQRELEGVRQAAQRLEREQTSLATATAELAQKLAQDPATAGDAAKQADRQDAISRRVEPLKGLLDRLENRLERNRPEDQAMQDVLDSAQELIEQAQDASTEATDALDRAAKASPEERVQQAQAAQQDQSQVQDALIELAQMLDQGQESWAIRRTLERLLTEQRQLQSQTGAAQSQTQGKRPEELTSQERADQDRLAQRQEQLSQRTADAAEDLEERAEQLEQNDPGQAETMREVAQQLRREQVAEKQRNAAEQINQNQNAAAQQNQQQASESLQQALEEFDKNQQRRDEALRRLLADVMQTLDTLITRQETELAALGRVMSGAGSPKGLDVPMIDLNRATLALADRIESEKAAGPKILEFIDGASQAQADAIASLRLASPDLGEADAHERTSLSKLREARDEAQKQDEQAEQRDVERQRAELRDAYRQALERAVTAQADAKALLERDPIDRELTRRERTQARQIGATFAELRLSLAELREKTSELAESGLFNYAHQRLDRALDGAATPLTAGEAPLSVKPNIDAAVRVLSSLVTALDNEQSRDDEFREDEGSGGGGGGGEGGGGEQPLVPPIAELRLLKMMQEEALDRTRAATNPASGELLDEVARLQQELAEKGRALIEQMSQNSLMDVDPAELNPPDGPDQPVQDGDADAPEPAAAPVNITDRTPHRTPGGAR
jgi:hypothetical protein